MRGPFACNRISQHRYSAAFCNGGDFPLVSFMSKPSIRNNLTIFNADIAAAHQQGLRYILGYGLVIFACCEPKMNSSAVGRRTALHAMAHRELATPRVSHSG